MIKLSAFIKALLDNHPQQAADLCQELQSSYPIVLTRNFDTAKLWVKSHARGTERYGLLASSEGKRLRGAGIWVPTQIDHVNWFLKGKDHVDSSYYLEVAASEFKVQGLEVDYAIVAWDADFRYINGDFDYFRFRGTRWNHTNIKQRQQYQKNAYRVLLTRARQGLGHIHSRRLPRRSKSHSCTLRRNLPLFAIMRYSRNLIGGFHENCPRCCRCHLRLHPCKT